MIGPEKLDWPWMSPDLATIENSWQFLKMKLRKKNLTNCQSLISAIKREWKSSSRGLATTLVHSVNSRISQVIKSDGDFV